MFLNGPEEEKKKKSVVAGGAAHNAHFFPLDELPF
jgi:hypothetical protein